MAEIGLIGFGEAAQAFATGWRQSPPGPISAFDIKILDDGAREDVRKAAETLGVACGDDHASAVDGKDVVFSLVTADRALEAARQVADAIGGGTLYLDCNSCSPGTKRKSCDLIESTGGRYVDVAVMAPVHPRLHRTPLLIAGSHAAAAERMVAGLGMDARIAGDGVGAASTIKMLRSVMVKGMEALSAECVLAARCAGVEDAVIASLSASDPELNWPHRFGYNLERMTRHGVRRAAEMREVAATVDELGLPGCMSRAAAEWQQSLGTSGAEATDRGLDDIIDAVLAALERKQAAQ